MPQEKTPNDQTASWMVDEIDVQASLTIPEGKGPFPAVIFVAGSGPTDRNWNTPLIPGANGSGALLARALTENGFVTLRYDKRASGPHGPENAIRMAGKISMQGHVDELAGGVKWLANRPEVDPERLFVLTNSEGIVHALNYQTQGAGIPFAGMVLTSPPARVVGDVAHGQIAGQLASVPGGEGMLAAYDAAIADFLAGRSIHVDENLPTGLQQMILAVTQPVNQPFARELWTFDPMPGLARITVPVLIVIGKKDIQVDWQTDGPIFDAAAREQANIRMVYFENANHVLKYEPKPRAELTVAEVMATYSADQVLLDPEAVTVIASWLRDQV